MKKSIFALVLLMLSLGYSCKNQKNPNIPFTGITQTDNFGAIIGTTDTTDWRSDDKWTDAEKKLFSETLPACSKPKNYRVMFYPNPARKKTTLYVVKDSATRFSYRLVDKKFNVIMSQDSVYNSTLAMDMSSFQFEDTIRIYYKFITPEKCEYQGHGDIYVKPYK